MEDADSMEECEVLDMVRGLLVTALHRLCGSWCVLRRWASAGHVKNRSTEIGFSLLQKEQFSGWRCETR